MAEVKDLSWNPTWLVGEVGSEKALHIIPVNDLRVHEPSPTCWCDPALDHVPNIWVHHALDGRELLESLGAQ